MMETGNRIAVQFGQIEREASRFRLQIRRSAIHRRGVFALDPIPPSRRVIEYTGRRLTLRQAQRLQTRLRRLGRPLNRYLACLSRRWVIDGATGNGAQFINHCCDPNLGIRRVRGHLLFFSKRRIRAGDELTTDYRYQKGVRTTLCHCGSPRCRGTINLKG